MSACQSNHHPQLQHPNGMLTSWDIFPASRKMRFIVCRAPNVYQQCTLGRLDAGWRTPLESTAEKSLTGEMTFLYLPTSTTPIIHWRKWRLLYSKQAKQTRNTVRSRRWRWFLTMGPWVPVALIETLRLRFFDVSHEPRTSRSHVIRVLPSGLRFEVHVWRQFLS